MATANPSTPSSGLSRWRRRLVWGLAFIGGALLALYWPTLGRTAQTGASFAARMGCSCRYIAGRPLGQCREDFEPGMRLVLLSEDDETRTVTARVPLLARQSATLREGEGCVSQPWQD